MGNNGLEGETQVIYGNTPSKSNCYKIIKLGNHSSLAKTKGLKEYENNFYIQCDKYRNKNIVGYIEFYIKVYYPSQRSDLDNSLKIVLDCLQKVKAFPNDNKVVKIVAHKYLDKKNPRIEFSIIPAMDDGKTQERRSYNPNENDWTE